MKCVVAMMQHETNTFSPLQTKLAAFASGVGLKIPPSGQKAIEIYGDADFAFAGLLDVAKQHGVDINVPIAAYAEPSGKVCDKAFDNIAGHICEAVAEGCDLVLLDLHGAMVTESYDDGEGELLRRIRVIAPHIPIAVALDFHTNLTAMMVDNCTVIDGYRTYPHVDMRDTGKRAAFSLFEILHSGVRSKMCWKSLPMMTHMLKQTPSQQPMKDLMNDVIAAADSGHLFNASIFGGFPLADIPHVSFSVLIVENAESDHGEGLVNEICQRAWEKRSDFIFEAEDLTLSIQKAKSFTDYPVVIADHGDNSGAGGSADDMTVLSEMLAQGLDGIVAGPIWDPGAVEQLANAGRGATVELDIGGKTNVEAINQTGKTLSCRGVVENITDGVFTIEGPMQTGLRVNLGQSVLLDIGQAKILVTEERWEPYDPGCFTQAGIDVKASKYILVKSRQHFRATFEAISSHIVLAAGPGVCSSDYSCFEFQHFKRPIYPLDMEMQLAESEVLISKSDA